MSPEMETIHSQANAERAEAAWRGLYRVGGVAALVAALLFLSDVVVLPTLGTGPESASGWFTLLQTDRAGGLLRLYFSDLAGLLLMFPVVLALYAALGRSGPAGAALAGVLAFAGIAIALASNMNYSLLYLSGQYAAAESEALLAAGEAALAAGSWGTGPLTAGFIVEGAFLIFSVIMLRSRFFGKALAWVGIVAHGLDCLRSVIFFVFAALADVDVAASLGVPLLWVGGTLQLLWYPWIALKLFRLGRPTPLVQAEHEP